jgi:hypothetical protein
MRESDTRELSPIQCTITLANLHNEVSVEVAKNLCTQRTRCALRMLSEAQRQPTQPPHMREVTAHQPHTQRHTIYRSIEVPMGDGFSACRTRAIHCRLLFS